MDHKSLKSVYVGKMHSDNTNNFKMRGFLCIPLGWKLFKQCRASGSLSTATELETILESQTLSCKSNTNQLLNSAVWETAEKSSQVPSVCIQRSGDP